MYRKATSQSVITTSEIEINGEYIEVEFTGDCMEVDNGIGKYECHGYVGFDSQPGLEVEEISWDKTLYSDDENKIIEIYLDEHEDEIIETICEKYEPEEPDYPEPDFD